MFRVRSVQGKFLAYVVPLVLASTVVVFGFLEINARRSAEAQLRSKLEKLVDIQSAVIAESLWNVANEQIELTLTALLADTDVLAAAVYDEGDNLVAAAGDSAALDGQDYVAGNDIVYDFAGTTTPIGRFEIALTDARLAALARERLTLVIVLATIFLAAVIGAALVANRQTIGRPLALLLASLNRAQDDGPRQPVDWRSDDEIGRVVQAFNDMQERQEAHEARLHASRDDLERRVEARTSELAQAQARAQQARDQLTDAIESISEGFALFDRDDRLVVVNRRYREIMLGDGSLEIARGTTFAAIIENAAARHGVANAEAGDWIERQLVRHRRTDHRRPAGSRAVCHRPAAVHRGAHRQRHGVGARQLSGSRHGRLSEQAHRRRGPLRDDPRRCPVPPAACHRDGHAGTAGVTIDLPTLRRLLDVIGGDVADLQELIDDFQTTAPDLVSTIRQGHDDGDTKAMRIAAHTLKSNARDFGALELAELCGRLEKLCQEDGAPDAGPLVAEIVTAEAAARRALAELSAGDVQDG